VTFWNVGLSSRPRVLDHWVIGAGVETIGRAWRSIEAGGVDVWTAPVVKDGLIADGTGTAARDLLLEDRRLRAAERRISSYAMPTVISAESLGEAPRFRDRLVELLDNAGFPDRHSTIRASRQMGPLSITGPAADRDVLGSGRRQEITG
jgi:hypothetical protein